MSVEYSILRVLIWAGKNNDGSKNCRTLAGLNYYYEFITGEVNNSRPGERVTLKSVFVFVYGVGSTKVTPHLISMRGIF